MFICGIIPKHLIQIDQLKKILVFCQNLRILLVLPARISVG